MVVGGSGGGGGGSRSGGGAGGGNGRSNSRNGGGGGARAAASAVSVAMNNVAGQAAPQEIEWENLTERYSFEDSDRFEEDSLCSWSSEPESLCNNWRGWRRPIAGFGFPKQIAAGEIFLFSLCRLISVSIACSKFGAHSRIEESPIFFFYFIKESCL